jgi:hypothetical protein
VVRTCPRTRHLVAASGSTAKIKIGPKPQFGPIELERLSAFSWTMLGWARYLLGDCKASVVALEKFCALRNNPKAGDPLKWFLLSMAHGRLGEKDKSRDWYERVVDWLDKHARNDGDLRRFRDEAAELLGVRSSARTPALRRPNGRTGAATRWPSLAVLGVKQPVTFGKVKSIGSAR